MFVVTATSGHLGHAIVRQLIRYVPADKVVATCRSPHKVADLQAMGVVVRRADYADTKSLASAFRGASQVLLVSSNARASGGDPLAQHRNAIAAARAAGAQRLVYTSHMAAGAASAFPPMRDHAATEAMLRGCGMTSTALRHGFYAASGIDMLAPAIATGALHTAADGPVAWTAHADLAEAAARILTRPPGANGPSPPLVADEALDLGELARIASELTGKPIVREVLADDAMRRELLRRGLSQPVVEIRMGFYLAARRGEFSASHPALAEVLGRPPARMRELLAEHLAA